MVIVVGIAAFASPGCLRADSNCLSFAPGFSPVYVTCNDESCFNSFCFPPRKPLKRLRIHAAVSITRLKPGANGMRVSCGDHVAGYESAQRAA
jgi:hypothetical protein